MWHYNAPFPLQRLSALRSSLPLFFHKRIGTLQLRLELSSVRVNVQSLTQDTLIKLFWCLTEVGEWCPLCCWRMYKGLPQWQRVPDTAPESQSCTAVCWGPPEICDLTEMKLLSHSSLCSAQQSGGNFFSNFSGHWSKCSLRCYYPEEKLECLASKMKFMCPAPSVDSADSAQDKHSSTKHVHKLHEKEASIIKTAK